MLREERKVKEGSREHRTERWEEEEGVVTLSSWLSAIPSLHSPLCPTVGEGVTVRVANPAGPGVAWFQWSVASRPASCCLKCMSNSFELQEQPQHHSCAPGLGPPKVGAPCPRVNTSFLLFLILRSLPSTWWLFQPFPCFCNMFHLAVSKV